MSAPNFEIQKDFDLYVFDDDYTLKEKESFSADYDIVKVYKRNRHTSFKGIENYGGLELIWKRTEQPKFKKVFRLWKYLELNAQVNAEMVASILIDTPDNWLVICDGLTIEEIDRMGYDTSSEDWSEAYFVKEEVE